ncbi:MAG: Hsp20/alpha crystallin family protein [Planctomycetia bacterium]|nr:Hsp20/alpha crystallin family protein [Planctomycetia bacterium]
MTNCACKDSESGKKVAKVSGCSSEQGAPVTLPTTNETIPPLVDIIETDKDFIILADMPGAGPETIDVSFDNGELTIFGAVEDDADNEEECVCVCCQCEPGDYARKFQIGDAIDTDNITATFENGVLAVTLPKREEVQPKKISISKPEKAE